MQRGLWTVLAVVVALATVFYTWRFFTSERLLSPKELADTALMADDPQQRESAAAQLIRHGGLARNELRRVLVESDTPEVRAACIQSLAALQDYESMGAMLDALEDSSAMVRARAGQAVDRLLGANYGFRYSDPPAQRAAQVKFLRKEWEQYQDSEVFRQYIERLKRKQDEGP